MKRSDQLRYRRSHTVTAEHALDLMSNLHFVSS